MQKFNKFLGAVDRPMLASAVILMLAGVVTMNALGQAGDLATKQMIWIVLSLGVFFIASRFDYRFLRRTKTVVGLYVLALVVLLALFVSGQVFQGAQSWFDFGIFVFQPADPAKLVLVILLAKYFSRRHIEIANIRHIFVSGFYAAILCILVFLQPDFGSAIIIFLIWLGMVLVSGISKKHLLGMVSVAIVVFSLLWNFGFADYQKDRVTSFLDPLSDLTGAGYNAYQSIVAVGSGQIIGKGYGFGTQSRLQFLPEYETDFVFAAFAEEWGMVGVLILFGLFGLVLWRVVKIALSGETNFETLFGFGVAIMFLAHIFIHVGTNIGLLPITGTTIPFMSYGGSHLMTEMLALGILSGMSLHASSIGRGQTDTELVG